MAFGYLLHAFRRAIDRWTAVAALALSVFEAATLLLLMWDLALKVISLGWMVNR